jgi:hypothetical protein
MTNPLATGDYRDPASALEFLKRTRSELRSLQKVRVWADRLQVFDVNGDFFELRGVGYSQAVIAPLLKAINAAFDPETIRQPPPSGEYRELGAGRRHAWAEDRVM